MMTDSEYNDKLRQMINEPFGFIIPRTLCVISKQSYGSSIKFPDAVIDQVGKMLRRLDVDLDSDSARQDIRDCVVGLMLSGLTKIQIMTKDAPISGN